MAVAGRGQQSWTLRADGPLADKVYVLWYLPEEGCHGNQRKLAFRWFVRDQFWEDMPQPQWSHPDAVARWQAGWLQNNIQEAP